ncbi:MAG: hypothetical protein M0Z65_10260 [Firmicutes bacterium]|uniref:Uncharacterized protein n=1 Tax=Melghirimyces thermohalophilus TaxID=1236220 RepID=A0A1G6LUG1_9BACL|nr:hypothetical protein [Melghirimyces thermohalophilus]MDA8353545.1 hypothetical protein [Bacillota bacterium]SDC46902.1 hypothetical protein SAMN04488112_108133 [Melghirimyces thermohalophilus]
MAKNHWIQALLVTAIAINLMLVGILIVRHQVEPAGVIPASAKPGQTALRSEIQLQYQGTTQERNWEVEHYRKVEVFLDKKGRVVKTKPTGEEKHVRYWKGT